jgi:TPP-dependent pyruvate/acetoin dehydrogenase alpha subunit
VEIQAARVADAVRSRIDQEIEDLLDQARLFAEASPEPDPSGALDYLYSSGMRGRGGTA